MTNNPIENDKLFRAEKTTKNQDDFKVLIVGLLFGIFILLVWPLSTRLWDSLFTERPFIRATVEIFQKLDYDRPMILYDADAIKTVEATWTASIVDEKGQRLETRRGLNDYVPSEDKPKFWTWEAWFDNGSGAPSPDVPDKPFKVCVSYVAVIIDTKVSDESPETCSSLFNPKKSLSEIVDDKDKIEKP